jgi:phosphoglycerate dehydrogenase-like enzyme
MLPAAGVLTVLFAHPAYRLREEFERRATGMRALEARSREELEASLGEADILVVSGFWRDELLPRAPKLRFIQSISAGVDQFGRGPIGERGIRLASAQGSNERAVAEHAMALILALTRRLPEARDNQAKQHWRGMIGEIAGREDELGGKTLLIIGLGRIGGRLAHLAKAFDLRVVGLRRNPGAGAGEADAVHATGRLHELLAEADIVALTCPLTPETTRIIDGRALALMKSSALLVNVARGRCVDEAALIAALREGRLAGAGLDCFEEEPLPAASPLWGMANVLVTPHTAGETRRYEANVIDLLLENLGRLQRGDSPLRNQIV